MTARPLRKVLVANRGEIAVRVIRACREAGIASVAVYSDPDRDYPHAALADEAYSLSGVSAAETYLSIDKLLDVARRSGADAVHPGYGFLAENPAFVDACDAAGLTFIGPPAGAMRQLGSKTAARQTMQRAGVPIVPGTLDPVADAGAALSVANEIGYPIALKAVSGGGGKGMRVVRAEDELAAAFRSAASEALAAFGDPSMYVERLVERPRHVEVQFLADAHGNAIHLGERECSIQRRHQKLLEESPSPIMDAELRAEMGAVAVRAARAVGYVNAGTAEFLVDQERNFYFLEVNARLQVEHPVTEQVTGLDLVRWQLRIAAGEPLTLRQEDISFRGHAIECRIYAEDPDNQFFPSTGRILALREPSGPGVRLDSGVRPGLDVSLHYDPMLAKLIVWGEDRTMAIDRLRRALSEYLILGLKTDLPLHRFLTRHPAFISGEFDTGFLEREWHAGVWLDEDLAELLAVAAVLIAEERAGGQPTYAACGAPGSQVELAPDRSPSPAALMAERRYRVTLGERVVEIGVEDDADARLVTVDGGRLSARLLPVGPDGSRRLIVDGRSYELLASRNGSRIMLAVEGVALEALVEDELAVRLAAFGGGNSRAGGAQRIVAPMPGLVVRVNAAVGQAVTAGESLVVLQAMKMENELGSPRDGTVRAVAVDAGQAVEQGQLLVELE